MMYAIYNNDGSIKYKLLNEFVMQGNSNVNELFVAIEDRENWSLYASFKLPNGSTTTVVSSTPTTEFIEGLGTFTGRKILLSNAETLVAGALQMNVVCLDENDTKIVAFNTYITVNETGIRLSDPILLTVQEYENLISEIKAKMSYPTKYVQVTTLPDNPDLDTIYVLKGEDDLNEVFMFNGKTESWIPLGSNRINLGLYYTKAEGQAYEDEVDAKIENIQTELSSVASGSPKGVYDTLSDLETAYPDGTEGIYVVLADGHWYYWNSVNNEWNDGGTYLSTGDAAGEDDVSILKVEIKNKIEKPYQLDLQTITVSSNSLILKNGTIYNGDAYSNYKLIGPETVDVGEIYEIRGYTDSAYDVPLYIFMDDNNQIIEYYEKTSTDFDEPKEVVVPYGATKLYINTHANKPVQQTLYKKTFNELNGNEIIDYLNNKINKLNKNELSGSVVWGKWWQTNGTEYTRSDGCYLVVDVEEGQKYLVSGIYVNSSFVVWEIRGTGNILISRSTQTGDQYQYFSDTEIVIPEGGTKLYINGMFFNNNDAITRYPLAKEVITYSPNLTDIDKKMNKQIEWKKVGTYNEGKFLTYSSGKVSISTFDGYNYTVANYDKNKKYRFTGCCKSTSIPILFFTDADDYVIGLAKRTVNDFIQNDDTIVIPDGTEKIYVQGAESVESAIEEAYEKVIAENPFKNQVGVCLGDSVMQGIGAIPSYSSNFPNYKPVGLDAPYWLEKTLGCTIYNGGLGGASASGSRTIDFKNIADCIVSGDFTSVFTGITQYGLNGFANYWYNQIKDLDFNNVDFILINFGFNDWNFGESKNDFKAGLRYGINKILEEYPNLKIYLSCPSFCSLPNQSADSDTYANTTSGLYLYEFAKFVEEIAEEFKVPFLNLYYKGNINSKNALYYCDNPANGGPHRNKKGYKLLGEQYAKFIGSN